MKKPGALSFITLSAFSYPQNMEQLFLRHHQKWAARFDHWTMESTLKKLEGDYWNFILRLHFFSIAILLLMGLLISQPALPFLQFILVYFGIILSAFILLKYILYKPRYEQDFLPLLHNTLQHLTISSKDVLSKAKSAQYKTFTLLLIQYVFQRLSGCSKLSDGNLQRELLCKQYGISNDTLDALLKNLLMKSYQEQTPKLQTQILDYFSEANHYFESLNCKPGVDLLKEMLLSLQQAKKLPF
jgi:hypothetical protein